MGATQTQIKKERLKEEVTCWSIRFIDDKGDTKSISVRYSKYNTVLYKKLRDIKKMKNFYINQRYIDIFKNKIRLNDEQINKLLLEASK